MCTLIKGFGVSGLLWWQKGRVSGFRGSGFRVSGFQGLGFKAKFKGLGFKGLGLLLYDLTGVWVAGNGFWGGKGILASPKGSFKGFL